MIGFDEILAETNRIGLNVITYAIFGMPDQTIEEMVDTLIYLMGKRILIGPSVYYPTPGTPLYERCKRDGILPPHPSQWRSSALPIETKEFNRLDIITLLRLARTINFIKGKMDEMKLNEGMTLRELYQVLKEKVEVELYTPCLPSARLLEAGAMRFAQCDKDDAITWADLLLMLFKERAFFSLMRNSGGKTAIVKERSLKKVLDHFFERAWKRPILKSRID
jgi:hypothetical protein